MSLTDLRGFGVGVLNEVLTNGRIKLISTKDSNAAQGYYTVTQISEILHNSVVTGYDFELIAINEGQEGTFVENEDNSFIIVPLPSNAEGTGGGTGTTQNIYDAVVVNGGAPITAASTSDDLLFTEGTDIDLVALNTADGGGVMISHASIATTDPTAGTNQFINSLTIENGHITAVNYGTATGTSQTTQLPFPTLSGNFEEEGFSGGTHTHTFTLSGTDGFTIDPALASNVATIAQNAITTVTVDATWTATQDNLSSHIDDSGATRTFTTFRPVYVDTQITVPTSYTLAIGDRVGRRIRSGSTISIQANASGTTEAIVALSDTDFPSPSFRTCLLYTSPSPRDS